MRKFLRRSNADVDERYRSANVITGAGRAFSVGGGLKFMRQSPSAKEFYLLTEDHLEGVRAFFEKTKPLIQRKVK